MTGPENRSPAGAKPRPLPIRWWPALVTLLVAATATIWIRVVTELNQQERTLGSAVTGLTTGLVLLLWWVGFSRARVRLRLVVLGSVVGAALAVAVLFHLRGVTGDLLPVLEWRWSSATGAAGAGVLANPAPSGAERARLLAGVRDYPQFLGPRRNATLTGARLAHDWQAQPPRQLWRQRVGAAWSGFAVAGRLAVTQEQQGDDEAVVAYDLLSGQRLWTHADHAHYHTTIAGEGPRATPTITDGRVYTLGATGRLNCLDLQTGRVVWTKDIVTDNQSHVNEWGMSGSPLVLDGLVVVSAGGPQDRSLVAYAAATGKFVWGGGNDGAGYSSPCVATLAGVRQILIFTPGSLDAHDPRMGRVLWSYPWPRGNPHVAIPVMLPGDRVLVSSGYGVGSEVLQVTRAADGRFTTKRVWRSIRLKAKFTNVVARDGYIYGLDDGVMVCLDAATGELKWKEGRYGHGQEILLDDVLLVTTEDGQVVMLEPTPAGHRELTRFRVFNDKTWNPPALAGAYLLMRNDLEAACYRLPLAAPNPGRLTENRLRSGS
ncbi:MAG: PQQ-binding-like beta-propeller repeat protein [Verrucomicrobia bacterium]|nr:PQQ-binding-like beta-propeller repeat protein [Verrucomicrobiota bacterium]